MITLGGVALLLVWGAFRLLRAAKADSAASGATINAVSQRLAILEDRVSKMPQHTDLSILSDRVGRVEGAIEGVREQVKAVRESQQRMERGIDRVTDWIIEQEKRA